MGMQLGKDRADAAASETDVSDRAARVLGTVDVTKLGTAYDQVGMDASRGAAASGTVLATSGDLPAGHYEFFYRAGPGASGNDTRIQKLSAANAVQEECGSNPGVNEVMTGAFVAQLAVNEEVRIYLQTWTANTATGLLAWRRLKE